MYAFDDDAARGFAGEAAVSSKDTTTNASTTPILVFIAASSNESLSEANLVILTSRLSWPTLFNSRSWMDRK